MTNHLGSYLSVVTFNYLVRCPCSLHECLSIATFNYVKRCLCSAFVPIHCKIWSIRTVIKKTNNFYCCNVHFEIYV